MMNLAHKPIALAMLVAATYLAGPARVQASNVPAAPLVRVTYVANRNAASEEPQRHFTDAVAAYAKRDYESAAADIRQATEYLRLEAARASGGAKRELDRSIAELDRLAASVRKGAVKDERSMAKDFAKANRALALEHRSKAAEAWTRKEAGKGFESLDRSLNALGPKVGAPTKAQSTVAGG
jgi:hypothetical protein